MRRQTGIAILTAVAVAAIVAAIASFMAWRHSLWLRQVENLHDQAQARAVARAAVDLTRLTLQFDARQNNLFDHAQKGWGVPFSNVPVERGTAGGQISDAQGRFNLNNLMNGGAVSEPDLTAYRRLLATLGLSPELAATLLDWIDPGSEPRDPAGAKDPYYLGLPEPYRAANRPLLHLSELSRVKGYTPEVIEKLSPYVVALPQRTTVNVNFARAEVLSAVIPKLDLGAAQALVAVRDKTPFLNLETFRAALPAAVAETMGDAVNVRTNYFFADVNARFGRVTIAYRALLERPDNGGMPRVVWMLRR